MTTEKEQKEKMRINITITAEEHNALKKIALQRGTSVADVVRESCRIAIPCLRTQFISALSAGEVQAHKMIPDKGVKKHTVILTMPELDYLDVKAAADKAGWTVSAYIRSKLKDGLNPPAVITYDTDDIMELTQSVQQVSRMLVNIADNLKTQDDIDDIKTIANGLLDTLSSVARGEVKTRKSIVQSANRQIKKKTEMILENYKKDLYHLDSLYNKESED